MSRTSTIPYTPTLPGWRSTCPRSLSQVCPHANLATPTLPTPPRSPVFHTTAHGVYHLSTHLVPAAYPRLTPDISLPEIPAYMPGGSPSERRNKLDVLVKQVLQTQSSYQNAKLGGKPSERPLWNCVNRYVRASGRPRGARTGITLFLVHANGLHKETWEPMLQALLDAPAGEMVEEAWTWDAVQHGDAAVVNAANQNGIFDWLDNTRDIANFLLHYLPEEAEATVLPTGLTRVPASVTEVRAGDGYRTRKLVVVGHSFGGCTSLRVANDFPKLFSSFVLVDPVIHRPGTFLLERREELVLGALARRNRWSSREEALQLFEKLPFFAAWHPAVLRVYVDHALIDEPEGGVRLKMSGLQEGLSFTNDVPSEEMWELLEGLDESISLRWVIPERPLSIKELTYERVWRRPANASNVVFHFSGHLIVQQAPLELARDISDFLLRKYNSLKSHL